MPNKDWYWDRFDVDVKQGELDLSESQTSALTDNERFTDTQANTYETRFIDELYGTDERAWAGEDAPYDHGRWGHHSMDAEIGHMGSGRGGKGGNYENPDHVTWGLDLVRDWTDWDFEKNPVGSDEHYEHQTRGQVDWAHYYDDNAYQAAFKDYKADKGRALGDNMNNLEDFLTAESSPSGDFTQSKVDFLDYAKTHAADDDVDNDKELRDTWDNQYVDQFDPDTATPYTPTYLDIPDLWGEAEAGADWETPDTPISVVKPDSLPTLGSITRRQVEVPDSIKHFGEAKSAPTESFTAGGQSG